MVIYVRCSGNLLQTYPWGCRSCLLDQVSNGFIQIHAGVRMGKRLGIARNKRKMKFLQKEVAIENGPWFSTHIANAIPQKITTRITKTKMKPITKKALLAARVRYLELTQITTAAYAEQLKIRNYLADTYHDGEEGSKTITEGDIKFVVKRTLNRTITREEADRLRDEHPDIYALALRMKPEVRDGEYRKHAEVMDSFITTKPGPPTLEFR